MWPILIDFGAFQLPTYGTLLVTGIVLGLFLARRRALAVGLDGDRVFDLGLWVALWGMLGSKLLLVITDPVYLSSFAAFLSLLRAGGVFYGGLIGALLAAVLLFRRYRLPVLPTIDTMVPSVALGHFFGRLGCFAAGCCYGDHCDLSWAVTFTDPKAQELSGTPLGVAVHPVQLYEAAFNLANYVLLAWFFRRRPRPGRVLALYLMAYGTARFCLEFLRGDDVRGFLPGNILSTSQGIAALMVPVGLALLFWTRAKRVDDEGTAQPSSDRKEEPRKP